MVTAFIEVSDSANTLFIIVGDHQPKRPVREKDALKSVPIHLISRDPDILSSFETFGYTRGFFADQEPPHDGLESFFPHFLEALED